MSVSIIVPTFNGLSLLQKHLPNLLLADEVLDAELIIADDGSTDSTAEWLEVHVPQAIVVRLKNNRGFSAACNAAIQEASGDFLLLMNNDVSVTQSFLPPLRQALEDHSDAFAVSSSILLPSRNMMDEGAKIGGFHHGVFYVGSSPCQAEGLRPTLYATACSALYRKERVAELGGFDTLYSPFYWEDVDLSYRAQQRGWSVLYEPRSVVYHMHETTTSRFDPRYKQMIRERNQFYFVWKNITDRRLLIQSRTLGPLAALRQAAKGDRGLWEGYRAAIAGRRGVRNARRRDRTEAVVADRALLAMFASKSKTEDRG